jgi:tetratricopeptide (TPR) repeat protein
LRRRHSGHDAAEQGGVSVRRFLIAMTALSLVGAARPATGTRWTRVTTPHFVVSGDASADDVRQVAVRLEMLNTVFARVLPGAAERSLLPTFVIVFGGDRAFKPYQPVVDGRAVPVGGYAIHDPLTPCMVIRLDRSDDSFRTIVHEYAHVLFDAPGRPLWLTEGVADYYSTTLPNRDRRHVVLGDRIPDHVAQVSRWWVPIAQVVSRSRSAKIWNDQNGLSFYAESWLLVHYLTRRTPEHGAQLRRFVDLLATGVGEADAFEQAIGPSARVDADLRRYVSNGILAGEEVAMPAQVGVAPPRMQPMSEAEVEATLGRLLFQLRRDDEALTRLNSALRLDPDLADAHATLGLMQIRQGHQADALESFRRANARASTSVPVAYHYALLELQANDAGRESRLVGAYSALERVLERRDGPPEALAVLGIVAGRLGRLDEAEPLLRNAAELEPTRFTTQLELANVSLRLGKFDEARAILRAQTARAEAHDVAILGQRRGWLAMAEARASVREELADAAGLPDAGRDRAIERTGSFPVPPQLRTPGVGEERVLGLLDAVDCVGPGFVAKVTTRSGPVSLAASSFASVHLASARDDVSGALPCGPRPRREAVYVTWATDHKLVAIEFLPKDLQQR